MQEKKFLYMLKVFVKGLIKESHQNKLLSIYIWSRGFPGVTSGEEPACQRRGHKTSRLDPWVGKITWRRASQPTPVFLLREYDGQRSLVGYGPQGCKESGTTEAT